MKITCRANLSIYAKGIENLNMDKSEGAFISLIAKKINQIYPLAIIDVDVISPFKCDVSPKTRKASLEGIEKLLQEVVLSGEFWRFKEDLSGVTK